MDEKKEEDHNLEMQEILHGPPPMIHTSMNDVSNISSSITMDTRLSKVEMSVVDIESIANQLKWMVEYFLEFNVNKSTNEGTHKVSQSSKIHVTDGNIISDRISWCAFPGTS